MGSGTVEEKKNEGMHLLLRQMFGENNHKFATFHVQRTPERCSERTEQCEPFLSRQDSQPHTRPLPGPP